MPAEAADAAVIRALAAPGRIVCSVQARNPQIERILGHAAAAGCGPQQFAAERVGVHRVVWLRAETA